MDRQEGLPKTAVSHTWGLDPRLKVVHIFELPASYADKRKKNALSASPDHLILMHKRKFAGGMTVQFKGSVFPYFWVLPFRYALPLI